MLRITKSNGVQSIKWFTKQEMIDNDYLGSDVDSFVIIPGVTHYQHIYTAKNYICFDSEKSYIAVEFGSEADLERYFIQLLREIKLNQITNINFDVDKKSN